MSVSILCDFSRLYSYLVQEDSGHYLRFPNEYVLELTDGYSDVTAAKVQQVFEELKKLYVEMIEDFKPTDLEQGTYNACHPKSWHTNIEEFQQPGYFNAATKPLKEYITRRFDEEMYQVPCSSANGSGVTCR